MAVTFIWQYDTGDAIPGEAQDLGNVAAGDDSTPLVMFGHYETDISVVLLTDVGFYIGPYDGLYTGDFSAHKDYYDLLAFGDIHRGSTNNRGFLINQRGYEIPEFPVTVDIADESVPVGETSFSLEEVFQSSGQVIVPGSSVVFSDGTVFASEETWTTTLSAPGEYKINYNTGEVETYSTTNGGTVDYTVTGTVSCHSERGSNPDNAIQLLKTACEPNAAVDGELSLGSVTKMEVQVSLPSVTSETGVRQISMYITFSYTI
jgi:hypothetical protein